MRRNQPGPFQIQAAIDAVHATRACAADTDWSQIVALYDQLMIAPTPRRVNRAVAVAEVDGPDAALEVVDAFDLDKYVPFHVTRADLLKSWVTVMRRPSPTTRRSSSREGDRANVPRRLIATPAEVRRVVVKTNRMTRRMTATEARAKILGLLDKVAEGEEIETRNTATRWPAWSPPGPDALRGRLTGVAMSVGDDEALFGRGAAGI